MLLFLSGTVPSWPSWSVLLLEQNSVLQEGSREKEDMTSQESGPAHPAQLQTVTDLKVSHSCFPEVVSVAVNH